MCSTLFCLVHNDHSSIARRFHSSLTSNKKWNRERSHESYAKNYSIVYQHDEPLASRNMRCDPFHQVSIWNFCCSPSCIQIILVYNVIPLCCSPISMCYVPFLILKLELRLCGRNRIFYY